MLTWQRTIADRETALLLTQAVAGWAWWLSRNHPDRRTIADRETALLLTQAVAGWAWWLSRNHPDRTHGVKSTE